jgi:Cytochrome c7 and related cytochrome c
MAQIFHRSTNFISRFSVFAGVFLAGIALTGVLLAARAPYLTNQFMTRDQPIQFSHKHHVGDDGIDCRYCHTAVESSATAGVPPTKTCMNCHQEIWFGSATLEPVRESYRKGEAIHWQRVHNLPHFVYFDHSIHVNKGVGCVTCHGRVDEMPFTYEANSLLMSWCVECHRNPRPNLRPREAVFDMAWQPPEDSQKLGDELFKKNQIRTPEELTSCSTCHR